MGKSGSTATKRPFWSRRKESDIENEEQQDNDLLHKTENGHNVGHDPGEFVPQDGGWGWIVCLTSLWANGTVFGIINTFGIIYVQMREHYSKDDPEVSLKTAFVGSTCTGVTFLMCTVSSILSDRIGIRPTAVTGAVLATGGLLATAYIERLELLYLTFGLMLGIGSSMVYSPSLVILGHYFKKHMGLVNGIVAFGSSLFTLCLTRILPYLLTTIDIKYCFLFLAGLQAMLILFTFTWIPVFKKEDHLATLTMSTESVYQHCNDCCSWTKKFLSVKIWRQKAYVIWVLSLGVALFGYFVPFFHLPKHIADNFPGEDGSLPILCLSITSGVSRIICGKVADLPWVSRIKMQQLAFLILGISTICIPFSKTFGGIIAISLAMGVCDGVFVCLLGPIAFDVVGPAEASQAIGFLLGIFALPFTIGPPVAGYMYDSMGDYRVAFHVAGIPPILGSIIMFFIPKVTQNYPAVTETQEFASISMVDVYNEVRGPKANQSRSRQAAGPSGPATELEFIRSNEVLYLGTSGTNIDDNPPLEAGNQPRKTSPNGDLPAVIENEPISEKTPMLNTKEDNNARESDSFKEGNQSNNEPAENAESKKSKSESDVKRDEEEKESDKDGRKDVCDSKDIDKADVPIAVESSSLLDEVGKYFEANRVSFEGDKTVV